MECWGDGMFLAYVVTLGILGKISIKYAIVGIFVWVFEKTFQFMLKIDES